MTVGKILIAGDLFPTADNLAYFTNGDANSLFGEAICQLFRGADLALCNLEGALTDHPGVCRKTGPVKIAPTAAVASYKQLGIDCCLLANNHVTDGGHQGVVDTMRTLDEAEINHIGAGKDDRDIVHSFVREVGGLRFGFYNVAETMYNIPATDQAGVWLYDEYVVCRELEKLKKDCDYLIVLYHGGIEKFAFPSPDTRKRFHRMADSGADMILVQHTHCIGCEEWYNGSYLLYGQGDFLLKNFAPGLTDSGLILELDVVEGKVEVKKHLVRSVDHLFVRYDEKQDFAAFEERSALLQDEAYVLRQFQQFCDGELALYLTAFKSPNRMLLRLRRFASPIYKKWLFRYNEWDLMFALHTLRSEQNRETAITGIKHLLNM